MGRESIKVELEPVTGEKWETARGQALSERVDEDMRHVLRARAELKHRKNLGEGVDGQPQPEHLCGPAQCAVRLTEGGRSGSSHEMLNEFYLISEVA